MADLSSIQHIRPQFQELQNVVYGIAVEHGWHEEDRSDGEFIALMHSELSEALESLRHGDPPDSHIPEFKGSAAELADAVIRILDFAALRNIPLFDAIIAKVQYNDKRPYKHGGKKF